MKNKKASLDNFVLVVMVLVSCLVASFLMINNSNKVVLFSSDVENVFDIRTFRDSSLLQFKVGFDNFFVNAYEDNIKKAAVADFNLFLGYPTNGLDSSNAISLYFLNGMNSALESYSANINGLEVSRDYSQNYFIFTKKDFNASSGVNYIFKYYEGKFHLLETKRNTITTILWNYTYPLNYSVSFSELGLDSYSYLVDVLDNKCVGQKDSKENFKNCLALNLVRWNFTDSSVVLESFENPDEGISFDYYLVNFTTKKVFSQLESPRAISFSLATSVK